MVTFFSPPIFTVFLKEVSCRMNVFAEGQGQNADARCVCVIFNNSLKAWHLSKDAILSHDVNTWNGQIEFCVGLGGP